MNYSRHLQDDHFDGSEEHYSVRVAALDEEIILWVVVKRPVVESGSQDAYSLGPRRILNCEGKTASEIASILDAFCSRVDELSPHLGICSAVHLTLIEHKLEPHLKLPVNWRSCYDPERYTIDPRHGSKEFEIFDACLSQGWNEHCGDDVTFHLHIYATRGPLWSGIRVYTGSWYEMISEKIFRDTPPSDLQKLSQEIERAFPYVLSAEEHARGYSLNISSETYYQSGRHWNEAGTLMTMETLAAAAEKTYRLCAKREQVEYREDNYYMYLSYQSELEVKVIANLDH